MTTAHRRIITECMAVIREAADQAYMAHASFAEDRKMLDYLSRQLGRVHAKLEDMLVEDTAAAGTRAKSLPKLLNEGIL